MAGRRDLNPTEQPRQSMSNRHILCVRCLALHHGCCRLMLSTRAALKGFHVLPRRSFPGVVGWVRRAGLKSAICCRFPDRKSVADFGVRFALKRTVCPGEIALARDLVARCHWSQGQGSCLWRRARTAEGAGKGAGCVPARGLAANGRGAWALQGRFSVKPLAESGKGVFLRSLGWGTWA